MHFKVGRTSTINRRLAEHNHRCRSLRPVLLGYCPTPSATIEDEPDANEASDSEPAASLALSTIRPSTKVPYASVLERLVHLELADVAANNHPTLGIVTGRRLGVNRQRIPCVDCKYSIQRYLYSISSAFSGGHIHEEIFTFRRLPEPLRGREFELLVEPVVQRWGDYVSRFVSHTSAGVP